MKRSWIEIVATFGAAMSKVMRFRKTSVVLFSDRVKGTASALACIVLDRSLEAILAIRFRFEATLERIIFYYPPLMNCGAGLYTLAFS